MNKIARMILSLTLIGVVSGGVLSLMYQWSLPKIKASQVQSTNAAIFKVLPETKNYQQVSDAELTYFNCFDINQRPVGTAIICQGNGYQGVIKIMVGVNADFTKFTGMTVLEQVETPGLGAKIAEKDFQAQFKGLATRPPIEYVKGIKPEKANQIQAITGATISSRAVVNIINRTVEQWLQVK